MVADRLSDFHVLLFYIISISILLYTAYKWKKGEVEFK